MPFVPIDPKDTEPYPVCRHPEHDPPNMVVITRPVRWVCPGCGQSVSLYPKQVTMLGDTKPRGWLGRQLEQAAASVAALPSWMQ